MEHIEQQITELALKNIAGLAKRNDLKPHNSDNEDFIKVSIGELEKVLRMAFELGEKNKRSTTVMRCANELKPCDKLDMGFDHYKTVKNVTKGFKVEITFVDGTKYSCLYDDRLFVVQP